MNQVSEPMEAPDRPGRSGPGALMTPAFSPPRPCPGRRTIPTHEAGRRKGRPLDGYLGTVMLVLLALFIVGKSARR